MYLAFKTQSRYLRLLTLDRPPKVPPFVSLRLLRARCPLLDGFLLHLRVMTFHGIRAHLIVVAARCPLLDGHDLAP
ncbi:hypothetical protein CEXT_760021 [Caerostris extrusa]|uniref:Uncharacterized protein n=1 Tax=Caerostris extrusa TaxID=172846 RepID=A0AAV4WTD3_CAEEX|nr:hypothetical protein CEXT_760021 [Caerostris extrusa]